MDCLLAMDKENVICFDIVRFLEEYERLPCLWNKIHHKFKDRIARSKAEELLMTKFGIEDIKTLRKKIRSIRGTYNTEARKIKSSRKTGSGTESVYIPKLYWFQTADRFLRATTEIYSESNLHTDEEDEENGEEGPIHKETDNQSTNSNTTLQDLNSNVTPTSARNSSEAHQKRQIIKKPVIARFRKKQNSSVDNAVAALEKLSNAQSENEFIAFGHSIATQLQKLPLSVALELQAEIQNLVTNTRLQNLQQSSLSDSSTHSPCVCTMLVSPTPTEISNNDVATMQPASSQLQTFYSSWPNEDSQTDI